MTSFVLSFLCSVFLFDLSQVKNLIPGMSVEDFYKSKPELSIPGVKYNDRLSQTGELVGLSGHYSFVFEKDLLKRVEFHAGSAGKISFEEFSKSAPSDFLAYQQATKKLLIEFERKYGKTQALEDRNLKSYQPAQDPHSVELTKAKWGHEGLTSSLAFWFEGTSRQPNPINAMVTTFGYRLSVSWEGQGVVDSTKAVLGMTASDFAKAYPSLFPNGYLAQGELEEAENLFGLGGQWTYEFEQGKLKGYSYRYHLREESEGDIKVYTVGNFNRILAAAREIKADLGKTLGLPKKQEQSKASFETIAKRLGYFTEKLLAACWQEKRFVVQLDFNVGCWGKQMVCSFNLDLKFLNPSLIQACQSSN